MTAERADLSFDLLPGVAIGPFRLGMSREEAREIARRRFGTETEARGREGSADWIPSLGIAVSYDANGRCTKVEVQFGYAFGDKCGVRLLGRQINWMRDDEVIRLCKDRWPDVASQGYWYDVPSAGLRLAYYDTPSDASFCSASVFPPARGQ